MPEGSSFELMAAQAEPAKESPESIAERVTRHSREFDQEIQNTRAVPKAEVQADWQVREWKIGNTLITALGVSHVPETFLEYRAQIERAIAESDMVVNEFAPEALGFYDRTATPKLRNKKSKFNENYDLEQLRQAYLKNERRWHLGVFHHEVELLCAKYGRDMALADLTLTKDAEKQLDNEDIYAYGAETIDRAREMDATLKKQGLIGAGAVAGVAGLKGLIGSLETKKPMGRRDFIRFGVLMGTTAAAEVAGIRTKIPETPPQTAVQNYKKFGRSPQEEQRLETLRNAILADSLQKLSRLGYKKIAFIYGTGHLPAVEAHLQDPSKCAREISGNQNFIEKNNSDAFRIYRQARGQNNSDRFVASTDKVWKRLPTAGK